MLQLTVGSEVVCHSLFFFFFSSRRRHTRFDCDWSSDVCSSDLGYYTSWIQTTATLGLFLALLLILGIRSWMGEATFGDWGWRIPFLLSGILLVISIWIRLSLNESPVFQKMKDEGTTSRRPLTESFGEWGNAKIAIFALLGATAGEAVVWYGGQFYALFFLTQTIKGPAVTAQIMIVVALALGTPAFLFFGLLSDQIGR